MIVNQWDRAIANIYPKKNTRHFVEISNSVKTLAFSKTSSVASAYIWIWYYCAIASLVRLDFIDL
jgi:hypothetical protein